MGVTKMIVLETEMHPLKIKWDCRVTNVLHSTIYTSDEPKFHVNLREKKVECPFSCLYNWYKTCFVYPQPASLAPASFTVDSLQRLEAGDADTVRWGPPTQMTAVTAATRLHLATAIMLAFNARLSMLPKMALMHLCKAVSKQVTLPLLCYTFLVSVVKR